MADHGSCIAGMEAAIIGRETEPQKVGWEERASRKALGLDGLPPWTFKKATKVWR